MSVRPRRSALALALALLLIAPAQAGAAGRPNVAALQVALRAVGVYGGTVDGYAGRGTRAAVRAFQRRHGLRADGVVGRRTRRALGRRGRPGLGRRSLFRGRTGWDVAAFQFRLAWHGFPSGPIDGGYGSRTAAAVARYQIWRGLRADGVAGRATLRALRARIPASPLRLSRPVRWGFGDRFGPRDNRFHSGQDFPAPYGRNVRAAARGVVTYAGYDPGGYGNLIVVAHRRGVRTWYAHLSRFGVRRGQRVGRGRVIGAVGATGRATGAHLHFEVRVRGAVVDPRTGL